MRERPRSASFATTPRFVTPLLLSNTLRAFCVIVGVCGCFGWGVAGGTGQRKRTKECVRV